MTFGYIVNNITLSKDASFTEAFSVAAKRLARLGIRLKQDSFSLFRKSIDARRKDDIKIVYSVLAKCEDFKVDTSRLADAGITTYRYFNPSVKPGNEECTKPIVVVGSGPAGLFAALELAEKGYRPILIERGGSVEERQRAVQRFKMERVLDLNTNIQFGAGGAGTFSDGKLVTRIGDEMSSYVLHRLVELGAPQEIEYLARPHIGTDILSVVVDNAIKKIRALGGTVMFNTLLTDINEYLGNVKSIVTDKGIIECSAVIFAVGHSARDTYSMLIRRGFNLYAKPFSVGMRIEHPTELIDYAMFGSSAGDEKLGHAEYNLSYNTKVRGVYTFCMCPGGEVVAATSEEGGVVTNGMSYHSRSGKNSNAAVLCSVFREDYGADPRLAIEYQRRIESLAFKFGGSDYSAPYCTVGDFLNSSYSSKPTSVQPTYFDGCVRLCDPEKYLPKFICDNLRQGITAFDKKINGFASSDAILTGAETRTSAPLRIIRDNDTRLATGYLNFYPAGEGAGYAGGITSAAIDGIKTAFAVISRFKPIIYG